ncbi:MAG: hypothetical protein SPD11_08885 [Sphaerochaetaceae bacterium]|nr:hypothetical protein [Sphaerochaetaceae bacterium]
MGNAMNQFADKLNPSSLKRGFEFIRQDYPAKQNEHKMDCRGKVRYKIGP